jgi:hypothetical protein
LKHISAILGSPKQEVKEKFALLPVRMSSAKIIWLEKYVTVEKYYDGEMSHPIRSNTWTFKYTKNEWLLKQVKGA